MSGTHTRSPEFMAETADGMLEIFVSSPPQRRECKIFNGRGNYEPYVTDHAQRLGDDNVRLEVGMQIVIDGRIHEALSAHLIMPETTYVSARIGHAAKPTRFAVL